WKLPKPKISIKFCRNCRQQNHNQSAGQNQLIMREEQLFNQDSPCKEEKEQLQKDLEALMEQIWSVVKNTFSSSSSEQLEVLKSAVISIQQQEVQDQRWAGCSEDGVPEWRPQKCLSTHMTLLQNMVESRLTQAPEDNSNEAIELSSPVKNEVCRMGKCVNEDLMTVVRKVKDCYPPHMDILNIYAGLYHQRFSARLNELAASGLEIDDCSYLLLWVNHYYPHDVLKHKELDGRIKTTCLGSLLLPHHLNQLEEQYLTHKENKVELWLTKTISREEESWLSGRKPELIDSYYFSPLAIDVIEVTWPQVKRTLLTFRYECNNMLCVSSYKKRLKEFVNRDHSNVHPVIKAHLACEEQLR
uniref:Tumor necrosis factor, alpha-induced protein 2a n=1 Tax=Mastacembelus armatus TaxID=205130 RepID=A0A7N9AXE8_9TELE